MGIFPPTSLLAVLFVLWAWPALACSPGPDFTFKKAFEEASLVFRGLATETKLNSFVPPPGPMPGEDLASGDAKGRGLIDVKYELLETFKGQPDPNGIITTTAAIMGGCGVPIIPGWQVLFVVTPFEKDTPPEVADKSQGLIWVFSSGMLPAYAPRLEEALTEVRSLAGKK
jgi:hypothetical protein